MATKRVLQGLLTDVQIKSWIRAGAPLAKSDGGGLTFTLSKAGTAAWVLRYRMPGRRAEATIGNYPDITLAEARREASRLRAMIDAGKDPAAEKREAKQKARAAKTIDWLADDYRAKVLRHLAPNSQKLYERQLRRIGKDWRGRAVNGVAPGDVIDLIRKTKDGFATGAGWRETEALYIVTREMFKHAAGQHIIQVNPAVGISLESLIGKRPKAKVRLMLTDDELAEVMRAAGMNRQNQLSVWIILATCVRVSEFTTALREHIRVDQHTVKRLGAGLWHIPASKTGPAMDIPWHRPSWNGSASWTRWRWTPATSCRRDRWRACVRAAATPRSARMPSGVPSATGSKTPAPTCAPSRPTIYDQPRNRTCAPWASTAIFRKCV